MTARPPSRAIRSSKASIPCFGLPRINCEALPITTLITLWPSMPFGPCPPHSHGTALPGQSRVDGNWVESSSIILGFLRLRSLVEIPWVWETAVLISLAFPILSLAAIQLAALTIMLTIILTQVATLSLRCRLRRRLLLVAAISRLTQLITSRALRLQQGRFIVRTSWATQAAIRSTDLNL